jgi:hypothetical protein
MLQARRRWRRSQLTPMPPGKRASWVPAGDSALSGERMACCALDTGET